MSSQSAAVDGTASDGFVPAEVLASTAPVGAVGLVRAKPGRREELVEKTAGIVALTRAESGCQQFAVHTKNDDPDMVVMYERWDSGAALAAHLAQPFMLTFFAATEDLIAGFEGQWLTPSVP